MGVVTNGLTRVCDEIRAWREGREEMLAGLAQGSRDRKNAVDGMLSQFSRNFSESARQMKKGRQDFMAGLRRSVLGLQQEVRRDLSGAQQSLLALQGALLGAGRIQISGSAETASALSLENKGTGNRRHEPEGKKRETKHEKGRGAELNRRH